jgi:CRISPR/Cas system-associated protein Cas7 (RAMP superfamily)
VDALLEALFKLRYPFFSAHKERVHKQIKSMKGVKVCTDPFFEEGHLKIEFEAQSCKDIKKALDACRRYMEEGKFDTLFKLLCAKEEE